MITERLRAKRRGQAGVSWYADETYVKVPGHWCYLYRAIDRDGNLIDSLLSPTRDLAAATRFFTHALAVEGQPPQRVTTEGQDAYPCAIREILGNEVLHRCSRYLNSRLERDHRGVKQRYYPKQGFSNFDSAARFCRAFEEVRQFFRPRSRMTQVVSLAASRQLFLQRFQALAAMMMAA